MTPLKTTLGIDAVFPQKKTTPDSITARISSVAIAELSFAPTITISISPFHPLSIRSLTTRLPEVPFLQEESSSSESEESSSSESSSSESSSSESEESSSDEDDNITAIFGFKHDFSRA